MSGGSAELNTTLALNTKVEEDFVAPLASLRGSLEILRDFTDLSSKERQRFVDTALRDCGRLAKSIEELSRSVYAAGQHGKPETESRTAEFEARVQFHQDIQVMEISFADFVFNSSTLVDDFYNFLEQQIGSSGHRWYFLVNYGNCSVWPEAWVAFAHRGKKLKVLFSLGTARYDETAGDGDATSGQSAPDIFGSRDAALKFLQDSREAAKT